MNFLGGGGGSYERGTPVVGVRSDVRRQGALWPERVTALFADQRRGADTGEPRS